MEYSVIIPVYNEEKVIGETYNRLKATLDSTSVPYELIFIDDGSRDSSKDIIKTLCQKDQKVKLIAFSRNFGHQTAISAGLDHASGKALIIIDADLQDPPSVILEMIKKWKEGYEVVYGQRTGRKGEGIFKKMTAAVFYRLFKSLSQYDMPLNAGDFRLIDLKVAEALKSFREKNRYLRGLISWLGFKQTKVEYVREERFAGQTKYSLSKMLKLSWDAITSFSYIPLRLAAYLGFLVSGLSFIYLLVVIYQALFTNTTVPGWASLIAINLLFNGIVLIILGIFGEYLGRIYEETKNRPLYIISDKIGLK